MSKRMRKPSADGANYYGRLREYFGHHLEGLDVNQDGGEVQIQVVYCDYKHIDTVRRELAQMMPEVEFVKIKRNFTYAAETWILAQMINDPFRHPEPKIYVQTKNGNLELTDLSEIARTELRQLELDDEDDIPYDENDLKGVSEDCLYTNAINS